MPINSPLFNEASRQIKAMAQRQFARSEFGQLLGLANRAFRHAQPAAQVQNVLGSITRMASPHKAIQGMLGSDFGGLVSTIERYAKAGSDNEKAVQVLLDSLGEPGKLIKSLINPHKRNLLTKNIQEAMNLIRAYGGEVLPAKEWGTLADIERGLRAAEQRLIEFGYPLPETRGPPRHFPQPEEGRETIDTEVEPGRYQRIRADHPMLTGEMVPTPNSTNVYEFGYDIDSIALYVRFRESSKDGRVGGAGALYAYYGVTPEEFTTLYVLRNNGGEGSSNGPGEWVWDHLRQRGTQSGHKKDYRLVGIMGDYVPRKATLRFVEETIGKRGKPLKRPRRRYEEWYEERTVKTHEGRMVRSVLPTARVARVIGGRRQR
jgi:hypothetical protein